MLRGARTIRRLRKNGIEIPRIAYQEARRAGLEVAVLAAVLEQESGGGRNVWGHDRDSQGNVIWNEKTGTVPVTEFGYRQYRIWRDRKGRPPYGRMQGVGPCQLTWYSWQDLADSYGGCWQPRFNVRVGAEILARAIKRSGLHRALWQYNGSESYANAVEERVAKWRRLLA